MIPKVRNYRSLGRMGALVALCALMTVVPAWAQALWSDFHSPPSSPYPQQIEIPLLAEARSTPQTVNIQTYSSGPSVSVASSVVVPANTSFIWVPATVGPTAPNDIVAFSLTGPTSSGESEWWFE